MNAPAWDLAKLNVRGAVSERSSLKEFTWFRVGGPADVMFRPADIEDLRSFFRQKPAEIPFTVIGVGSDLLVRDGGVEGAVIRLPSTFGRVERVSEMRVRAGAAALDAAVARFAADQGIAGLEFLRGIPGTIGGALRMNAGCYGAEVKDVFVEARAVDASGKLLTLGPDEMQFAYRHSAPRDIVYVDAVLEGKPGVPDEIRARMDALVATREAAQPVKSKTGGSTFTNPPGQKAWQLIDEAGCRGMKLGGAQISEKHCNFVLNNGNATASDIEKLGEIVRARVKAKFGIELKWEIKRIGRKK